MTDAVSKTALAMAMSRALHRRLARSPIIDDPLAEAFPGVAEYVRWALDEGERAVTGLAPLMPLARARFFEEAALAEVADGASQVVLIGAGLDTFGHRRRAGLDDVIVFEVDKAATLRWKRAALAASGVNAATQIRYVEADLGNDDLLASLTEVGFRPAERSVLSWLGVTYYLSKEAITETMTALGTLGQRSLLVLDYFRPRETWDDGMVNGAEIARTRGEPWITTFPDSELDDLLRANGFEVEDRLTSDDAGVRYPSDVALARNKATVVVSARRW